MITSRSLRRTQEWHALTRASSLLLSTSILLLAACGADRPLPSRNLAQPEPSQELKSQGDVAASPTSSQETAQTSPDRQRLALLEEVSGLRQEMARLGARSLSQKTLASRVEAVNEALCRRAEHLLSRCPVARPLLGSADAGIQGPWPGPCGAYVQISELSRTSWIRMKLGNASASRKFLLKSKKGNLVSSTFSASGAEQVLTWSVLTDSTSPSPQPQSSGQWMSLGDATEGFLLEAADGGPLPTWTEAAEFSVGNGADSVLGSTSLVPWVLDATFAEVSALQLNLMRGLSACRITEDDLDAIAASGGSEMSTPEDQDSSSAQVADLVSSPVQSLVVVRDGLLTRLADLRKELVLKSAEFARQSDASTLIRHFVRRLGSPSTVTMCSNDKEAKVGSIEIYFQAGHLPDSDWDRKATEIERETEGSPEKIEIALGQGIVLVHSNEVERPLMSGAGYLRSDAFADLSVDSITQVRLSKGGAGYKSLLNCWTIIGWSRWGVGKKCEYQNRETHRYELNGIEIRLDGVPFFKKTGIDFVFEGDKNTWSTSKLSESSEYAKFKNNLQCTGGT